MKILASIDSTTWDMEPHTRAKHQILEEYLKRWFPILGTKVPKVIYLDGFAGPGVYSNGEAGSPIIAIKTATDHRFADRFKNIIFWFIEKELDRKEKLEQILKDKFSQLPEKFQYEVERSEFVPSLEKTLDDIEDRGARLAPTFAFIDPFGFSGMPMELIKRILEYRQCEVLITFMSSFIVRFNDERRESALDDLFGSKEWRQIHQKHNPDDKRRFVIDFYLEQLRNCTNAKFCRTFEMVGKNDQIIYHLVFATKNIKGLEAMKEAMMKVDQRGTFRFSDRTDPNQTFILDYSDEKFWVPKASGKVFNKFAGKTVTVEKVKEFVLVETPFVFRRRSILQQLEKDGKIVKVEITKTGKQRKKGTFPDGCAIEFSNKVTN